MRQMCFLRFACNNTDSQCEQRLPVFREKKNVTFSWQKYVSWSKFALLPILYPFTCKRNLANLLAVPATFVLILKLLQLEQLELMELFTLYGWVNEH